MLKKAKKRQKKKSRTTLAPLKDQPKFWRSTTYNELSKTVQNTFRKHSDSQITFKTNNKLKNKLQNPKDPIEDIKKSGIYEISCQDCTKNTLAKQKGI